MKMYESKVEQLELMMLKEEEKRVPVKTVDIVSMRFLFANMLEHCGTKLCVSLQLINTTLTCT